ncbi:MAG: TetR family transcriptional regulator [Candidatus Marinimicrobia bacterium]|nr:TetR family transcriptional regulator [Candidatus Neomarinimicrobiota bacterium]
MRDRMTKASRKAKEKEARRQAIIDAAEKIMFSKGLENATMDEIAEEADLSKGTLYYYFKNKEDLYLAINNRGLENLNQRFASVLTENRSGIELIRRLGEEFVNFVRAEPDYFDAMIHYEFTEEISRRDGESTHMKENCRDNGKQGFTYTIRALQVGMQDGSIDSKFSPERLAIQMWANMRGLTQIYLLKKKGHYPEIFGAVDTDQMFEDSMNLLVDGMKTDNGNT